MGFYGVMAFERWCSVLVFFDLIWLLLGDFCGGSRVAALSGALLVLLWDWRFQHLVQLE